MEVAPKALISGPETVEIALNIGAVIFDGGKLAVLRVIEEMGVQPGPQAEILCRARDV